MHITNLQLVNFKRFTDLTIDLSKLPISPKLVLLIGANGSGKSSVFDAFEAASIWAKSVTFNDEFVSYYRKNINSKIRVGI